MAIKGMKHFYKRTDPPFTLERALALTVTKDTCNIWIGPVFNHGYGRAHKNFTGEVEAHRFIYAATYGDIPKGLYVCHTCDTPLCVNPEHLFLGTQSDNMQDMIKKGRNTVLSGENAPYFGKKHSEETRAKMRGLRPNYHPSPRSDLHKAHITRSNKLRPVKDILLYWSAL